MADSDPPPCATLYVRKLDEKIKIPALINGLKEIFGEFGNVIDVVAKKNHRARGQAFVVFSSTEEASDAKDALQGFDLFNQPMEIHFAKTPSDATVIQETGGDQSETFLQHKAQRVAAMEAKKAALAAEEAAKPSKRTADDSLAERPAKASKPVASTTDDYLPPHKILILRELPEDYGKSELTAVFSRFPGFKEVRVVPGRKGIAFAEYDDETAAATARESMNGVTLGESTIRVTFQRS